MDNSTGVDRSYYMIIEGSSYAGTFAAFVVLILPVVVAVVCVCRACGCGRGWKKCQKEIENTPLIPKKGCCSTLKANCCSKTLKCCSKLDESCSNINDCFTLYRIVFWQSVQEVITLYETFDSKTSTTKTHCRQEFLFGGYRNPKRICCLHTYFLTMLVIVLNWFLLMFFDTAFYRKTTSCNDINVKRDAYMCFDVSKPLSDGPIDCTANEQNDDLHVLCYLKSFNIATALSLAFSFAQLVILLIYISFSYTLWCVKNCNARCALFSHVVILVAYIVFGCLVYGLLIGLNAKDLKYSEGWNIFYGDKILHIIMFVCCGVTIFFLTLLSPYCWLIRDNKEHYPTFKEEV